MRIFILLSIFTVVIYAIQFEVQPQRTRCISDDASEEELIVGKFSIVPEGDADILVKVYDPSNREVYSKVGSNTGKFAWTAKMEGEHKACFTNTGSVPKIVTFFLEMGETSKDYDSVAKKENLKPMEIELKRIEDMVQIIHEDMAHLKVREEEMRITNDATNARVMYLSVFSVLVLVSLGMLQMVYLKRFFVSKKMI